MAPMAVNAEDDTHVEIGVSCSSADLCVSTFCENPSGRLAMSHVQRAPAVLLNGAVDVWYARGGATSKEVSVRWWRP